VALDPPSDLPVDENGNYVDSAPIDPANPDATPQEWYGDPNEPQQ
jgi:hypothetical protein